MYFSETVLTVARAARQGFSLICSGQVEQAAALCYRGHGQSRQYLLISGRNGRKLGLPKGNIDPGETSVMAAAREAFEEAGVQGDARDEVLASYSYAKDGKRLRRHVVVHPLEVRAMARQYPEKGERKLVWQTAAEAARAAADPSVRALFQSIADGRRDLILAGELPAPSGTAPSVPLP
jgi:8-oxo-dGTP pyrophosphatase MutT (NUDIX family)